MKKSLKKSPSAAPREPSNPNVLDGNSSGNNHNFGLLSSGKVKSAERRLSHAVFLRSPQEIFEERKLVEQLCRIKERHQNGGAQVRNAQQCWAFKQLKLVAKK